MEMFLSSKIKIERANRHLRDFENEIISYTKRKPFKVVIENDNNRYRYVLRVKEGVPITFSCYIGDIIHNLRTSLDLLACSIVAKSGQSIKNVYFPFASGPEDLEKSIKHRHIDRAGEGVVNIIRNLKPYTGGNKLLRAIHDLDIADKHIALIPIAEYVGIKEAHIKNSNTGNTIASILNCKVSPIKDGQTIISVSNNHKIHIGQQFNASFGLTFGDQQPLSGQPVLETLRNSSKLICDILQTFEDHFKLHHLC